MKCPFCGHENTRVIDSRPAEDNNSIRRRRVCDECGKRFTTYEKVETIPLIIIKKDNNRESYDRSKIEAGVLRACHKRPVSVQEITRLVDEVENEIFNMEEKEAQEKVSKNIEFCESQGRALYKAGESGYHFLRRRKGRSPWRACSAAPSAGAG